MAAEKEFNYDVLVVGAGNAAMCSALAALEQGAKVGILEKASKLDRGGNSMFTGHMRFHGFGLGGGHRACSRHAGPCAEPREPRPEQRPGGALELLSH